jgi:hypothetical protein
MESSSKSHNIWICTIKNKMNIVDWTDLYFIFILHFGGYPFSGFKTHTNHRICMKVKNMSQLLELIFQSYTYPTRALENILKTNNLWGS